LLTKYPLFLLQIISLNAHTPRLMKRFQSVNQSINHFIHPLCQIVCTRHYNNWYGFKYTCVQSICL